VLAVFGLLPEPGPGLLPIALTATLLALGGMALAVWGYAYRRLAYVLTGEGLEIDWLGETFVAPYAAIDGIYTGQRLVSGENPLARLPRWPGIYVGQTRVRGIGRLHFFTTSQDPGALTVVTFQGGGAVLSARTPPDFRTALIDRVSRCSESGGAAAYARPASAAPWTAVRDAWLPVCVVIGLALLLVNLGVVGLAYSGLPDEVTLRFDAAGHPAEIGSRADLLHLPLIGLLGLVANGVAGVWCHVYERLVARVVWVGAVVLQAVLLVALVRLLQ
jgi:Bacterial PH domain